MKVKETELKREVVSKVNYVVLASSNVVFFMPTLTKRSDCFEIGVYVVR